MGELQLRRKYPQFFASEDKGMPAAKNEMPLSSNHSQSLPEMKVSNNGKTVVEVDRLGLELRRKQAKVAALLNGPSMPSVCDSVTATSPQQLQREEQEQRQALDGATDGTLQRSVDVTNAALRASILHGRNGLD